MLSRRSTGWTPFPVEHCATICGGARHGGACTHASSSARRIQSSPNHKAHCASANMDVPAKAPRQRSANAPAARGLGCCCAISSKRSLLRHTIPREHWWFNDVLWCNKGYVTISSKRSLSRHTECRPKVNAADEYDKYNEANGLMKPRKGPT